MKIVYFDDKDYNQKANTLYRTAARAIIVKDGKLSLIKSMKYGEVKFPGGGVMVGETIEDALVRETLEEAGLKIERNSLVLALKIVEKRKDLFLDQIFHQTSYYYFARAEEEVYPVNLDNYEMDLGYHLVHMSFQDALQTNTLIANKLSNVTWITRELKALETICEDLSL